VGESTPQFESSDAGETFIVCQEKRRTSVDVHQKDDSDSATVTAAEMSESESVTSSICSDVRLVPVAVDVDRPLPVKREEPPQGKYRYLPLRSPHAFVISPL
jgi:hypothetical protein